MRWLARILWLSAWAVWLWLGVGLHRELPRDWGPAIRRVPKEFVGFVHDSDVVVCRTGPYSNGYVGFDARTGERKFEPARIANAGVADALSLRHGVAVGFNLDAWMKDSANGFLHSFDFRTGQWKRLDAKPRFIFDVHVGKPWIALHIENGERNEPRMAVIDVVAGKTLGVWKADPAPNNFIDFIQGCWFTGDGDEIVLVIERNGAAEPGSTGVVQRFEHWSAASGPIGKPVTLSRVYHRSTKPAGGRIAMMGFSSRPDVIDVLDHRSGVSLISSESTDLDSGGQRRTYPLEPVLSPSGKALLGRSNCLWNVDARTPLWLGRKGVEEVVVANAASTRFGVLEDWTTALGRFAKATIRWTYAVRDLDTGAVCYRVWGTGPASWDFDPAVRFVSLKRETEGPAGPESEFVVVDALPNVNWTLLVICQAVLAAPLVLLWLILRWRRKRRLPASGGRQPPETAS